MPPDPRRPFSSHRPRRLLAAWLLALAAPASLATAAYAADAGVEVIGAGASFPAPLIQDWAERYSRETGVRLLYRSVGSGEGIRRVTARSADFAVTDVPLTQAELSQDDLLQFPLVVGAIAPVLNVPGIGDAQLKLTGAVLADIFLGRITRWDAPQIRDLNPGLALPDLPITVVHRSDGSGTSFVFTYYLSASSPAWEQKLGIGSRLVWPVGVGASGSDGVAQAVHDTVGAIGYVEYAHAAGRELATALLRNKAGRYAHAGRTGVLAALAAARWSRPGYYEVLVDRDGADSWPIVAVSFVLIHQRQEVRADALTTLGFLRWIHANGAPLARPLHYVPLDDPALIARIESAWGQMRDGDGQLLDTGKPGKEGQR